MSGTIVAKAEPSLQVTTSGGVGRGRSIYPWPNAFANCRIGLGEIYHPSKEEVDPWDCAVAFAMNRCCPTWYP
jgi:hypothetical protein